LTNGLLSDKIILIGGVYTTMENSTYKEQQQFIHGGVYTPKRAEVIRQAASEKPGTIDVNILDPSNIEEADIFAVACSREENKISRLAFLIEKNKNPRTPEQIKEQIVSYAISEGSVLVLLETTGQQHLSNFWDRVDRISNRAKK